MISGRTRVFALLGDPVSHSLSPAMHNAAFHALGLSAVYVPLRCGTDAVGPLVHALAAAGGGGNVTVPHEEVAADVVDRLRDGARAVGACNTFWAVGEECVGDNTDAEGFSRPSTSWSRPTRRGWSRGTGGSARAVVGAARERGARVAVLSGIRRAGSGSRSGPARSAWSRWRLMRAGCSSTRRRSASILAISRRSRSILRPTPRSPSTWFM